MLKLIDILLEG